MKPINFAVLGPRHRGAVALHAHRPDEGLRIIAVCGLHFEGTKEFIERCGPELIMTTDFREIIANPKVDAVFVCTPDHLHAEHAVASLEAGKHVFLEKPMAISIEDCDRILAAADKSEGKLFVGHNMRYFPVMRKMRELIVEGRIGRVEAIWCRHFINYGGDAYFKDWHSERQHTTSLLLQKGAHDIDIIHFLAGSHTRRVTGMGKLSVYNEVSDRRKAEDYGDATPKIENWPPLTQTKMSPVIDVEDHSMIFMQLANGVQASYMQCHYTPDSSRNYTIIGTEGRIENYGDHSSASEWATVHLWNRRMANPFQWQGNEVFRIANIEGSHGGSDPLMIQDFIDFLRGETPDQEAATPHDARMAVATGVLGARSLRNGSVPYDIT